MSLNYNQELIVDSDTERCGNYITVNYEFPFPEESILQARRDEGMRYQLAKFPVALRKRMLAK